MKLLLDSHAFLWFVAGDDRLGKAALAAVEDISNQRYLSIASVWELAIKLSLGKLRLSPSFLEFIVEETRRNQIALQPVQLAHVTKNAELAFHHRDPFDRMLIAQCLVEDWDFLSGDQRVDAYGVRRIW
jgi:PIN domain nuclease of toxin-antitoxin system